jgi:UDP-N-acetylglucosamine diphosphorylase/glucosamine-1-phosphate N-acetyltransferase
MTNLILFDDLKVKMNLLPLTFTRPIADIRVGILTIREKWEKYLNTTASDLTESYLSNKFPLRIENENLLINSSFLPCNNLILSIIHLKVDEALVAGDDIIAVKCKKEKAENFFEQLSKNAFSKNQYNENTIIIKNLWDIFVKNGVVLEKDFEFLTKGRKSQPLNNSCRNIGKGKIFIEEGASANDTTFNTTTGCIYIGKDAEVMEGSVVRGPFALCEHSVLKMSSKIYGATTIGPHSKVGGEVNNSVVFGYSNKAHDGFLGNSVIGEWCNLGADTNNSNLKNNYANVKLWNYSGENFIDTGLQFCGLIMGDHSKCGINTMFNTGTVAGVSSNIFGSGFPRNFIPSFSWGGAQGFTTYRFEHAIETAQLVMQRRNTELTDNDKDILKYIFDNDEKFRKA